MPHDPQHQGKPDTRQPLSGSLKLHFHAPIGTLVIIFNPPGLALSAALLPVESNKMKIEKDVIKVMGAHYPKW